MWEIEKAILITNNDLVYEKYKDRASVLLVASYKEVLLKARDLVHDRHLMLTHPQASSLKPNQTPYRSIAVYPKGSEDNTSDILLIEKCIETYRQWQELAPTPTHYSKKVAQDFKTIDLSVADNFMSRIY